MEPSALIESRLDEAVDGTGGGYGKYPGLTVAQVAERFRFLAEEGHGRSVKAVLRIVHEQTEARGGLGTQRILVALAVTVTLLLAGLWFLGSQETKAKVTIYLGASLAMTILFGFGAASVHRATVRGEAQVREIRRLALLTLDRAISKDDFVAKPLEREHLAVLASLKKTEPEVWQRVSRALSGTS